MERVFAMSFGKVYPLYLAKVEKKGRSREELDRVLCWLLGLDAEALARQVEAGPSFRDLFASARMPASAESVQGVVCGVRVETIEDPLMRKIRIMDKVVDELAKGRPLEKVIRG